MLKMIPGLKGILLDLAYMDGAGMDKLAIIGRQLQLFRRSGKPVIAAEDYYNQNQYYLASYADKIFINPMGGVYLNGFALYRLYFKEAIEKLQISYNVFRVGSFKSALEPLTRNSMSVRGPLPVKELAERTLEPLYSRCRRAKEH